MRVAVATFNRGRISKHALARIDVDRVTMSAQVQKNWMPRILGSMSLRPGMEKITEALGGTVCIPFVYSTTDTARIELSPGVMRILVDGTDPVERPAVTAAVTNSSFNTDLSGWTNADQAGATSEWLTGGFMQLTGSGYAEAIRRQEVAVNEPNIVHALQVNVSRGPLGFRVGTTTGGDNLVSATTLETGVHNLAFTPPGASFFIEFSNSRTIPMRVSLCAVSGAGELEIATPWETEEQCRGARWAQLNDVVYVASDGVSPRRIERRASNSWSVVSHRPEDGPFRSENIAPIRITPSATEGDITLTASARIFRESEGALYRIRSVGQRVSGTLSGDGQFTDPIRVIGAGSGREFDIDISGTWTGTLRLQRSIGEVGAWTDLNKNWTANASDEFDDDLDNVVIFYRIGFVGDTHDSGSATVTITYGGGSIVGVARVTGIVDQTQVTAVVLKALGGTGASEIWAEGEWSGRRGFPTAVALHEGRLWWFGRGKSWGSISDAFSAHNPDFEGDAGPINRYLGDGAVDVANWALPLQRLIVGLDGAEISLRSTSFDEVITPFNYNAKAAATLGSAMVPAVQADKRGYFVQRSGAKLYEMDYTIERQDYEPRDLTLLCPEIGEAGFTRIAVQRMPDTRIWGVRADGTAAVLIRDAAEDVTGWIDFETDGTVTDITVLPGESEDRVFFVVQRGDTWFHERLALRSECVGGLMNKQADSFVTYEGAPVTSMGGLSHLEDETVAVWADGEDVGPLVVAGGSVNLATAASSICAGLPYTALYKSAKPVVPMRTGSSLTQRGRARHVGLILADTHYQGIEFGPDFETMDNLPLMIGETLASGVFEEFDGDMFEFPGDFETDSRLCLRATAPRPATVLAAVLEIAKVST